ncbi:MAG: Holliday junction branch migration protein RuvA, partial [Parcubacteria group bacterium]|nr:Holliday junction branch migration protein RuvA [Parcubacteria group bacterium]
MISYLKGAVIAKGSDYIILEAGGVGYKVFVGEKRIASFALGQTAELYCYLYLRKDETL